MLLQPYLRHLEATAIFQRQQHALDAAGMILSEMYAYLAQIAPQQAGLLSLPQLSHLCLFPIMHPQGYLRPACPLALIPIYPSFLSSSWTE